ncbi:MAG: S-layer homology domain-containing protein, partial [Oscillospiraceae bacterium]
MKKLTSIILAACLTLSLTAGSAYADTGSVPAAQQIVQALGIITGDETGNLNLSANVTRGQFAKMMISASVYKDTISSTAKSSPFKDVKYSHWSASYVKAAVTAGWMTGYTDGTFRPDSYVTLKEAVSAVLKMLGYTSSDFSGSFPEAQIAKYNALGLNESISKTQNDVLTRQDCMNLFYNLMSTKNKSGSYYAATLGYTVNSSGKLDYSSLVLVNMKGPFIVKDTAWSTSLPFTASTATVYKNGSASALSSVSKYDVYYYNTGMRTIWAYSNKVTGVYTAASPSTSAPTSVTVAGKSYSITSSTAAYALSNTGSFGIGDTVTLLLGMNGDVVDAISPTEAYTTSCGVVVSAATKTYKDSSGNSHSAYTVTVACTDGNTYEYECSYSYLNAGDVVCVTFTDGKSSVSKVGSSDLAGIVNSTATALGAYAFSDDIQILDTTEKGSSKVVYPARLAGMILDSSKIKYYSLDSSGKLSRLILNDVTGDMYSYGIMTATTSGSSTVYKYIIDGKTTTYSGELAIAAGPVLIELSGSSI